ncbi:MAG TPA: PDZ domain-containing protein, partial [Longimicrobiales bacterium]|nr:PDZ domain-containing protein [Longimicrobiales bacterium]
WSADGSAVLFRSGRHGHPTQSTTFYTVALEGGMPEKLALPRGTQGELSADGRWLAYQEVGFWDPEWRNYRGGQALPIRVADTRTWDVIEAPWEGERHVDPVWLDGVVYFLSERDWAANIWSFDPRSGELRQRTRHADFDVKSLDAGGGVVVYEQGGWLHLLDPATDRSRQLDITVRGDLTWAMERWDEPQPARLQNAALSATGKRALFEYRGEILSIPAEHGDWRNLTRSSGAADRYPVASPDGSEVAWFSDRGGEYRLLIGDAEGLTEPREIALPNPTFYFRPAWSPDGARIAYTDTDMNLWSVELEGARATRIDTERYAHPDRSMNPAWSPDGRWIAYARRLDNHLRAIFVHDTQSGRTRQLTDGFADAMAPVWDAGGKYLWFLASTDVGLNTGWLDMTSYDRPVTRALYFAILRDGEPSPLLPRSDEEGARAEADTASSDSARAAGARRGAAGAAPTVTIDFDGIERRIVATDMPLRSYADLVGGPEGVVFPAEAVPNQQGTTLHRYSLKERKSEEWLKPVVTATVSNDRKKLLYRSGATWGIADATKPSAKPGDGRLSLSGVRVRVNPREEWQQMFREAWRYQRDFLYVDNVHGAPWDEIWEWYRPWVDHVRHRAEMTYVIDILGGEVAVGHSYTSGGDFPDVESDRTGLLGADLVRDGERFRIARIYTGEAWNPSVRAPLAEPGIDVREGDYLLAIDGVELRWPTNPHELLMGTANRQTRLRVNGRPSLDGARLVTVVPVASEGALRTLAWVEGNRRRVDELSDGRLAYVWLPNTGQGGYSSFNRWYFAQQDRHGAVIDERNNGGGSAADYIVDVLNRDLQGYFNSAVGDRRPFTQPMAGLWGPKVMVINERAGSGGDLMPYLFRQMGIGPLVGTKTWGGLVGTWDTPPFVDGGRMVAPRGGFFDLSGSWAVEGEGVAPDIEVEQTAKEVIAGRDPQLEAAVAEALRLLEENPVRLMPEPAPPIRWRRPGRNPAGGGAR